MLEMQGVTYANLGGLQDLGAQGSSSAVHGACPIALGVLCPDKETFLDKRYGLAETDSAHFMC